MHKGFKDYLSETAPVYKYTVKLAVDKVTDSMLDCIEGCLSKYDLKTASKFKETPIQESPLDFPNVKNSPVFIAEIALQYPASRSYLQTKIASSLGISEQRVVVYSENDPRKEVTDLYLSRTEPSGESKLAKGDYKGEEAEGAKGTEEQRLDLLKELETERKARRKNGNEKFADADKSMPSDYDSFDKTKEEHSPGLFGRMKKD